MVKSNNKREAYLKIVLFLIVSLIYTKTIAQDIPLASKELNDSISIDNAIKKLSERLIKLEEEKKEKKFSKLLRYYIGAKKYDKSLVSIDSFRIKNKNKYPEYTQVLFVVYEIYNKATIKSKKTFDLSFRKVLRTKIDEVVEEEVKSALPYYFNSNLKELKEEFKTLLNEQKKKETISIENAELLVISYIKYIVAKKTTKHASEIFEKIKHEKFIIENDKLITTKDGAEIAITIIRPRIKEALPAILNFSIYAGGFDEYYAMEAANNGYIGIVANTRGKRKSKNTIEPFEHDGKDAYAVIDWVSKQSWCNGKVGMYGGSYLGFSQWAATKKLHPALKTIIPQVAVGIGIDYPMHNNVFMSYMLRWIHYVENNKTTDDKDFNNNKKWDSLYNTWYKSGLAFNTLDSLNSKRKKTFQKWLNHPSYDDFWKDMVPYKKEFKKINIPVLTITGYYDDDQRGAFYYFNEHYKHYNNPEHYLLIGPYDHGGAQAFPQNKIQGYEIDSVAIINIYKLVFEWFDYQLKGKPKPEPLKERFNFQIMGSNQWEHKSRLKDFNKKKLSFYLSSKKNQSRYSLSPKKAGSNNYIEYELDFKNRNDADNYQDPYTEVKIIDSIIKLPHGIAFETKAFEKDINIVGSITAELKFITNKKDFDYNIRFYIIEPDGHYFFLNENIGRASYVKDKEKRHLLKPNKKECLKITNTFFTAKKIIKGSKLLVNIGVNKNPHWQINYGTGKDVSIETIEDATIPLKIKWSSDSKINIPILEN